MVGGPQGAAMQHLRHRTDAPPRPLIPCTLFCALDCSSLSFSHQQMCLYSSSPISVNELSNCFSLGDGIYNTLG